jgi:hypothetical protein
LIGWSAAPVAWNRTFDRNFNLTENAHCAEVKSADAPRTVRFICVLGNMDASAVSEGACRTMDFRDMPTYPAMLLSVSSVSREGDSGTAAKDHVSLFERQCTQKRVHAVGYPST